MIHRLARGAAVLAALSTVSACGLPRVGPNKNEIFEGSVLRQGDAFVLVVTDRVNAIAGVEPQLGFSNAFKNAGTVGADAIRPGDTLGLTIWENVSDGLLAAQGQNATVLNEVQVDGNGFIFVPYAGRIRAAGNTPEAVRRIITNKLRDQTPDPQVQVRRIAGDGATVTMIGIGTGQSVQPIERPTRTLSAMLAKSGGVTIPPETARITVVRGREKGTIFVQDLYTDPRNDIALRNGDTIIVEKDERSFTALGATGAQTRLPFDSKAITAIEAIAQVGGLNAGLADPTGVFVFRNEPEAIAEQLTGAELTGVQRVVYVLDLTAPNGMFLARDFAIRDGDTVYVTEAPFVQFNKTMAAITGSLGSVATASSLADKVGGN